MRVLSEARVPRGGEEASSINALCRRAAGFAKRRATRRPTQTGWSDLARRLLRLQSEGAGEKWSHTGRRDDRPARAIPSLPRPARRPPPVRPRGPAAPPDTETGAEYSGRWHRSAG